MSSEKRSFFKKDFDYEEDDYDRLKLANKDSNQYRGFTNKVTRKKREFDYEEDAYEPEKSKS
ncbi:MAG: hypothetical protein ACYCYE_17720 [Clostridia bacterium]